MTDIYSEDKRKEVMSKVKGKNTSLERNVRRYLWKHGIRYRKNVRSLPGNPDIVLLKKKIAIFINGCFWHGHEGCKRAFRPSSNTEYWNKKLNRNIERDAINYKLLSDNGWTVIVLWECELQKGKDEVLQKLLLNLNS